jgi:SAM-dependent methyltransferase
VREQRLVFGEVADEYDEVRAGYPAELVDAVLAYTGGVPARAVDVGAGTGKATAAFRARGVPVTAVEPDPAMAAVLRLRHPDVEVVECRFEDWSTSQDAGVPLVMCAQAWHWVDPARRISLAHRALVPGGVLALFGHEYGFADPPVEAAVHEAYRPHAPELLDDPANPRTMTWLTDELSGTPLFTDVTVRWFESVVPYPTARYRRLLGTFSNHRMLAPGRRTALHDAIDAVVDGYGGVVRLRLQTLLVLARRA